MNKKILFFLIGLIFFSLSAFSNILSNVSGKVVDAEDGKPIKNVLVHLVDIERNTFDCTTDEKGEFLFKWIQTGYCKIGFFPPAPYAWERDGNEMHPFDHKAGRITYITQKLVHGGILDLTLIDVSTNTPLEGFDVYVKGASAGLSTRVYWQPSDKQGKYRMEQLIDGKYELTLTKDGWGMKVIPDVEIHLKETTSMTIQYNTPDASKLEGVVKCEESGEPLSNIFVGVNRLDKYGWAHTYTDDDGRYKFLDLEPGNYKVKVIGLKDKIDDDEHSVYIRKNIEFGKRCRPVINFNVDCTLYFQKKWELPWYEKK